MAWFGEIMALQAAQGGWALTVEYYDDVTPDVRIGRTIKLPPDVTKPQAINQIKTVGAEIRTLRTLNGEQWVGQVIPI